MATVSHSLVRRLARTRTVKERKVPFAASFSSSSALAGAATALRSSVVNALQRPGPEGSTGGGVGGMWPTDVGDWSSARDQMEAISSWPSHPLSAAEQLLLAEAYVSRTASVLGVDDDDSGKTLCSFYDKLLKPGGIIVPRYKQGAVHCAVVAVTDMCHLQIASVEVAAMLLSGHAVSLAAPKGAAFEAASEITKDFPNALLQTVELGPLITLPVTVRSFRAIGPTANEMWKEKAPPGDFGGLTLKAGGTGAHGMAAAAAPFSLARINMSTLESSSRSHFRFNDDVRKLVGMLPGHNSDLSQVHNFLDLLWAFRFKESLARKTSDRCSLHLAPAHKHLLLTFLGTYLPEDVVKTAIISSLSPFHEPVTLHCVGLGSQALQREPLKSFLRLVQSGRSNLAWRVHEHKDWAAFLAWLHAGVDASTPPGSDSQDPVYLFSTLRNLELEVKRSCAQAGGVAWVKLFLPELFEVLRRWTRVVEVESVGHWLRDDGDVEVEVVSGRPEASE